MEAAPPSRSDVQAAYIDRVDKLCQHNPGYHWLSQYLKGGIDFLEHQLHPIKQGRTRTIIADIYPQDPHLSVCAFDGNDGQLLAKLDQRDEWRHLRLVFVTSVSGVGDEIRDKHLSKPFCSAPAPADSGADPKEIYVPVLTRPRTAGAPGCHPIEHHTSYLPDRNVLAHVGGSLNVPPDLLLRYLDERAHLAYSPRPGNLTTVTPKSWHDRTELRIGIDQGNHVSILFDPGSSKAGVGTSYPILLMLAAEDDCLGIDFNPAASAINQVLRPYCGIDSNGEGATRTVHAAFEASLHSLTAKECAQAVIKPDTLVCRYTNTFCSTFACHLELYRREWAAKCEPYANTSAAFGYASDRDNVRQLTKEYSLHLRYANSSLSKIEELTGNKWHEASPLEALTKDFRYFRGELLSFNKSCDSFLEHQVSKLAFRDARASMDAARDLRRLSYLGFVFLPLSLASSCFGMNVAPLQDSDAPLWVFIVIGLAVLGRYLLVLRLSTLEKVSKAPKLASHEVKKGWKSGIAVAKKPFTGMFPPTLGHDQLDGDEEKGQPVDKTVWLPPGHPQGPSIDHGEPMETLAGRVPQIDQTDQTDHQGGSVDHMLTRGSIRTLPAAPVLVDTIANVPTPTSPKIDRTSTQDRVETWVEAQTRSSGEEDNHRAIIGSVTGTTAVKTRDVRAVPNPSFQFVEIPICGAAEWGHDVVDQQLLEAGVEQTTRALFVAARQGNEEMTFSLLEPLLDAGAYIDQASTDNSLLHAAAEGGNQKVVERLILETGLNINSLTMYGTSVLAVACRDGHTDLVSMLVKLGADINARDDGGQDAIELAAARGHQAVVQILLDAGAPIDKGVLHQACNPYSCRSGNTDMVRFLLDLGADVNSSNNRRKTALQIAAHNNEPAAQMLLKAGANVQGDGGTPSPLHIAGSFEMVCLLLEYGADIMSTSGYKQTTPLHGAISGGSAVIAKRFLMLGADVEAKTSAGNTPLHHARDRLTIKTLLEHGADIEAKNNIGETPLHNGSENALGSPTVIAALLQYGADIEARDDRGYTPLHKAAASGSPIAIDMLLKNNANIAAQTPTGWTPLHCAACNDRTESCRVLIDAGADLDSVTTEGVTVAELAVTSNDKSLIEILMGEYGVKMPGPESDSQ